MDLLSHSDADSDNEQNEYHPEHDGSGGASSKKSNSAAYEMIPLDPGFEPTELDVICARGKEAYNHAG